VSSLPKSTRKQKGGVSFDPQLFSCDSGCGKNYYSSAQRTTKSSRNGDPAESVFYIQQGRVKLKVKSKTGPKKRSIAILGAGDFLGEACLIGQTVA